MLIAQFTDLHVGRIIETAAGPVDLYDRLVTAVDHLRSLHPQPDLIMLTGDLSNHGNEADYIRVREQIARLEPPVYIIPGNHDQRDRLRRIFAGHTYWPAEGYIQYTLEQYPLRIICLDTLAAGHHYGILDEERLAWVEERLREAPDRPTIIFMHHPPFKTGLRYPDQLMCRNGDKFGEIVARHPQIQAVVCAHVHRDAAAHWRGTTAIVTGSAAFANDLILYDVDDVDPYFEPPVCRLFLWENGLLTSHISYIGDYPFGLSEGVPAPPKNE